MTDRRERDLKRRLGVLVAPTGATVDIKHTSGGHLCATLSWGAAFTDFYFSKTPGDHREQKNAVAFVRRKLRGMGRTI